MRILSLNVNDFGGRDNLKKNKHRYGMKEAYSRWDRLPRRENAEAVLTFLEKKDPDLIVLQEFDWDLRCGSAHVAQFFLEKMAARYESVPSSLKDAKRPSLTILFVRRGLSFQALPTPHKLYLRAGVLRLHSPELIFYGTHVPFDRKNMEDMKFWDELIHFYKEHANEPVVLIGDFNAYQEGTPRKEKFRQLLELGAVDAWLAMGKRDDTPTFQVSRIDYALLSPALRPRLKDIDICPDLRDRNLTDHAAIVLDLNF